MKLFVNCTELNSDQKCSEACDFGGFEEFTDDPFTCCALCKGFTLKGKDGFGCSNPCATLKSLREKVKY